MFCWLFDTHLESIICKHSSRKDLRMLRMMEDLSAIRGAFRCRDLKKNLRRRGMLCLRVCRATRSAASRLNSSKSSLVAPNFGGGRSTCALQRLDVKRRDGTPPNQEMPREEGMPGPRDAGSAE